MGGFRFFLSIGNVAVTAAALTAGVGALQAQTPPPEPPLVRSAPGPVVVGTFGDRAPSKSFLGVNIWEVNAEVAKKKHLPEERGVIITGVVQDSAAEKAGIQNGDIVLEYNGQRVEGVNQFIRLVRETPVGRKVMMKIFRDGEEQNVEATIGKKKAWSVFQGQEHYVRLPHLAIPKIVIPDMPRVYTAWRNPRLGIVGESLEAQLADFFGVKEGVLIRSVSADTPASKAGLHAGDVITKVGDTSVSSPRALTGALRDHEGGKTSLTVMRKWREITIQLSMDDAGGGNGRKLERMFHPVISEKF